MDSLFAPRCVLVTGGAGFIGVNFVRWLLETDPNVQILANKIQEALRATSLAPTAAATA